MTTRTVALHTLPARVRRYVEENGDGGYMGRFADPEEWAEAVGLMEHWQGHTLAEALHNVDARNNGTVTFLRLYVGCYHVFDEAAAGTADEIIVTGLDD